MTPEQTRDVAAEARRRVKSRAVWLDEARECRQMARTERNLAAGCEAVGKKAKASAHRREAESLEACARRAERAAATCPQEPNP
jgi:hypothetical protein